MFEVEEMLNEILPINNQIVLLQCTTSYPTDDVDVHLNVIPEFREKFKVLVGYSSHDRGVILPAASVALGACFIEKHFTLDRTMKGPDHVASVEPRGMELIVKYANSIFKGLGNNSKQLTDSELPAKAKHGYSIVAAVHIKPGDIILENMLTFKQPGTGIKPSDLNLLIGKKAKKSIKIDDDILQNDVE
jgi:N,N'-diacetyllegionaminate synthase